MGKTNLSKNELERTVQGLMHQHDRLVAVLEAMLFQLGGEYTLTPDTMEVIFQLTPEQRGIRIDMNPETGARYYQAATKEERDEALRQVVADREARSADDDEVGSGDPEGERGEGGEWDGTRRVISVEPGAGKLLG